MHAISKQTKTILFLHAFHSSAASYNKVCALLHNQFNLVSLDFQGHGLSEHINIEHYSWYYSMEGFAAILPEFIDRLKLKNLFIVGDSLGGNSAVRSLSELKMLEGLILMGSVQAESVDQLFKIHHIPGPIEILFQKEFSQQECELIAAAYVDPYKNKQKNFKQMIDNIKHTDPNCREQFARYLKTQSWVNELQLIQKCGIPLMYIIGRDDGFVRCSYYQKLLLEAGLQQSQIHLLDHTRHIPQIDSPHLCAQLISDFVERS